MIRKQKNGCILGDHMEFISKNFTTIMVGAGILLIFLNLRMIGTPSHHEKERNEYMSKKVSDAGGTLVEIIKIKRPECPLIEELGLTSDVVYVPYKIRYEIGGISKEGWAILVISGTLLGHTVTENNWIFKL